LSGFIKKNFRLITTIPIRAGTRTPERGSEEIEYAQKDDDNDHERREPGSPPAKNRRR